jgi:hypothetical protein
MTARPERTLAKRAVVGQHQASGWRTSIAVVSRIAAHALRRLRATLRCSTLRRGVNGSGVTHQDERAEWKRGQSLRHCFTAGVSHDQPYFYAAILARNVMIACFAHSTVSARANHREGET